MTWRPALKISVLTGLVCAIVALLWYQNRWAVYTWVGVRGNVEGTIPFGYYDLSSGKSERYDFTTKIVNNELITTFASTDGNNFRMQGKFIMRRNDGERRFYEFHPVAFSTEKSNLMLENMMDLFLSREIETWRLVIDGQSVFVWQSGGIYLPPR
ncbi:hypothetical protein [Mangrovibacter plantisponsor]|uniref:Uncharacterized protein n=1 Tax=Mangrovibacter plantisponsor TaxID=451513 RepID=A0A317PJ86_9ENTR|nr:hypothetical protein [Mangrovibacter plantisponsor]PWW00814.1 hypothetical protein DES37_12412 [Mangrovibacter plantisponsor]